MFTSLRSRAEGSLVSVCGASLDSQILTLEDH